jgi:dihydropyrimidinase
MSFENPDIVLRGGQIVGSASLYQADIATRGGKIVAIGSADQWPTPNECLDVSGNQIFPGILDVHTHCQPWSPHVDNLETLSRSGSYGGVTTMIVFVSPAESQLPSKSLATFIETEGRKSIIDFGLHALLPDRPGVVEDVIALSTLGIPSFKLVMAYRKGGKMTSDVFLYLAMKKVAEIGGLAMVHAEDGNIIGALEDEMINAGRVGFKDYSRTRPNWAEEIAVLKAIGVAELTGCPLYVVHLSTREALKRIREANENGKRIWAETCPQYMLLNDELMGSVGPAAKIAPPLRSNSDLEAIWDGVIKGQISVIASDHAPHSKKSKEAGYSNIFESSFGSPGIETLFPVMYNEFVVRRGLPPWLLARRLSESPARIFGLYPQKGSVQIGSDADLVIVDPRKEMTIAAGTQHTEANYTLFEGMRIKGVPVISMVRGNILLKEGKLLQNPGYGKYLRRQPFQGVWKLGAGNMMI